MQAEIQLSKDRLHTDPQYNCVDVWITIEGQEISFVQLLAKFALLKAKEAK